MSDDTSITECLGRSGVTSRPKSKALAIAASYTRGPTFSRAGIPPFLLFSFLLSREYHSLNRST